MNASDYIDKAIELAETEGLTVIPFDFELPVLGRIDYEGRTIRMNDPRAKSALMTMAHELGHWFHYKRNSELEQPGRENRERMAYLMGWGVLKRLGVPSELVSKEDWRLTNGVALG